MGRGEELSKAVFRKVVPQTVEEDTAMEAIGNDHVAVPRDEGEMAERVISGFHVIPPKDRSRLARCPRGRSRPPAHQDRWVLG